MDFVAILGICVAMGAILLGQHLEGGHIQSLANGPAILIVLGGTIGAVMVETPMKILFRSLRIVFWIVVPPYIDFKEMVEKCVSWGAKARKEGLLGLEATMEEEQDTFSKKGLQLLVDGSEPSLIRNMLELDIDTQEQSDLLAAKVFESMGGYSPTIGIIGAVLGLIHVMGNLNDPSKLGSGIAVAFVATIYGVGLANIFFLPISAKLNKIAHRQARLKSMIVEGIVAIAEGVNPRVIEMKLSNFEH